MAYLYEVPNMSNTGVDSIITGLAGTVTPFTPLILLMIFMFIFIGGSQSQRRRSGYSDYPQWAMIGSIATFMVSLGMTLTGGIITLGTLVSVLAITIVMGIWYFLSRRQIED